MKRLSLKRLLFEAGEDDKEKTKKDDKETSQDKGDKKPEEDKRKTGINANKFGSIRKIYGRVYMDFRYLGERVREDSGLNWNDKNVRLVRKQKGSFWSLDASLYQKPYRDQA